jgi:hypothetical protein
MTWFEIFAFFGGPLLILAIGLGVLAIVLLRDRRLQQPGE